ncbi:hypothetical protein QOT17_009710 [Balamuthia mandrillaris]
MQGPPTTGELQGSNDVAKLEDLCSRPYKDQAIWFLNGFWVDFAKDEADKIWGYVNLLAELDEKKKAHGNAVDEFQAHRFLEKIGETLTVQSMRDKLRSTGAFGEQKFRTVPLAHFLLFKYNINYRDLVNAPQGSLSPTELAKAQKMVEDAQAACEAAQAREAELRAAERELKAQEDAYNRKTEELTRASETGGAVSKNKAKAELAQHLAEDPLPLRRAKITAEAAVRKAEAAVAEAQKSLAEAEEYLQKAKSMGAPEGQIWWMEKELQEARKYLPKSKGGVAK